MARKERIVRHTDDQLRAMQARGEDKSDWKAAAAMTDAEIEAAIADDPDEAGMALIGRKRRSNCRSRRPSSICGLIVTCWNSSGVKARATRRKSTRSCVHMSSRCVTTTEAPPHRIACDAPTCRRVDMSTCGIVGVCWNREGLAERGQSTPPAPSP